MNNLILRNPVLSAKLEKWPQGSITQIFGVNFDWYHPYGMNGHNGIDIVAPFRTPILAAHDGYIFEINNDPRGYGKHVRVASYEKDGEFFSTLYGHLDDIQVIVPGQKVKAGEVIGLMGNTGFVISTDDNYTTKKFWGNAPAGRGVHLHFGLRKHRRINESNTSVLEYNNGFLGYIDPLKYLNLKEMKAPLVKEKNRNPLCAVINGHTYWFRTPEEYNDFKAMGWLEEEIQEKAEVIYPQKIIG